MNSKIFKFIAFPLLIISMLSLNSCKDPDIKNPNSTDTTVYKIDSTLLTDMSVYDALRFGVKADAVLKRNKLHGYHLEPESGTDNAPALNKLIEKVKNEGGGIVMLPKGDYLVQSSIVLQYGVSLVGAGKAATRIILGNRANTHVIKTYASPDLVIANSHMNMVANLTIEGNRWNQTIPYHRADVDNELNHAHGIFVVQNGIASNDEHAEHFHIFRDLYIDNVYGTGIFTRRARGEHRIQSVYARRCGNGFLIGPDSKTSDCTADECEFYGFNIVHGSSSFVGCRAYRTGACVEVGVDTEKAEIRRAQPGFRMYGSGGRTSLASCISQNNGGEGFIVDAYGLIATGLAAIGNNMLAADPPKSYSRLYDKNDDTGVDPANLIKKTDYAGIRFTRYAKNCSVEFTSQVAEMKDGTPTGFQYHAIAMDIGAVQNSIKCVHSADSTVIERLGPPVKDGYMFLGINTIEVNGYLMERNTTSY